MRSRKSQMEIMGLAVIVILAALAMLFVLQFIILKQPGTIKKDYTHKELAANFLQAALKTTTNCNELQIDQLIPICLEGDTTPVCEGEEPCDYIKIVLQDILSETLIKWNLNYTLNISGQGYLESIHLGSPCPGERIPSTPCCPLPHGIMTRLDICS